MDTDVFSARLVPGAALAAMYEPLLVGRRELVSFQTAAEVRFGAILRGWGERRLLRMETELAKTPIVQPGPELVQVYAELRAACRRIGHPLHQKQHNADRWVAATAIRVGVPLVAHDRVFRDVPGLRLETLNTGD